MICAQATTAFRRAAHAGVRHEGRGEPGQRPRAPVWKLWRPTRSTRRSAASLVDFHTGELIFGEIAAGVDGAARLRYVRSIFDPEAYIRCAFRPAGDGADEAAPQSGQSVGWSSTHVCVCVSATARPPSAYGPACPRCTNRCKRKERERLSRQKESRTTTSKRPPPPGAPPPRRRPGGGEIGTLASRAAPGGRWDREVTGGATATAGTGGVPSVARVYDKHAAALLEQRRRRRPARPAAPSITTPARFASRATAPSSSASSSERDTSTVVSATTSTRDDVSTPSRDRRARRSRARSRRPPSNRPAARGCSWRPLALPHAHAPPARGCARAASARTPRSVGSS